MILRALQPIVHAQKHDIAFVPVWEDMHLMLDSVYVSRETGVTYTITRFRMYVGNISLWHHGKQVHSDSIYHLLDLETLESLRIPSGYTGKYDEIRFDIGTDSLTNVTGAMGGDLDPTRGMYWTWNSGYINLKLEGTCSTSTERGNLFQLHLGGYLPPYPTVQQVILKRNPHQQTIHMDVSRILAAVNIATTPTVMIPGPIANMLSKVLPGIFSCK